MGASLCAESAAFFDECIDRSVGQTEEEQMATFDSVSNRASRFAMNRRRLLLGAGAAAAIWPLRRVEAADEYIVYCGYGGSTQEVIREAFLVPFTQQTGIRVIETGPPDYAKVKAMIEAKRVEWDVMQSDPDFVVRGISENLVESIDYQIVSNKDLLPGAALPGGVVYDYGATVIAYRTDVFPAGKGPRTWAEFWDVSRFPARRALSADPYYLFPLALAADGVTRDKIYPIDVDRVFRSLTRIRPHIVKFYETFGQSSQLITDKEADLLGATTTRMHIVQQQGAPVYVELNEGVPFGDAWVIPRGSPRKANAMKFIAFAAQFDSGMALKARKTRTGMTQTRTAKLLEPEIARQLVTSPDNWPKLLPVGDDWWASNRPKMQQLMTAWLLKG